MYASFFLIMAVALSGIMIAIVCSSDVQAATSYKTVKVTTSQISSQGATKAIQAALDKAAKKATSSKPYKVVVASGSYDLTASLHIYSNTLLYMEGVTLTQKGSGNMIAVGDSNDTHKGYYYKNITIEGGTLNGNNKSHTILKAAHVSNFTVKNCVLKKVKNAHLVEMAGVKNVTITNCTFKNQTLKSSASRLCYEAIQIDILQGTHFTGYRYEDLANKNIVIEGCTFKDVPRGVGSHTAVLNNSVNGVTIKNCSFKNCTSAAIQAENWINCTISGNTIENSPRGIVVYSLQTVGTYLSSTIAKAGGVSSSTSVKYKTPASDQKIVIKDNVITVGGTDPYADYDKVGIIVNGLKLTKATGAKNKANGDTLPKGNYYVSGVTVSNNEITTDSLGIRLVDTRNATVDGNTVTYTGAASSNTFYGIQLRESSSCKAISNNTVNDMYMGIYLNSSSTATTIENNTIDGSLNNGIRVDDSAKATKIKGNTITESGSHGIFVQTKGKIKYIKNNTITGCGKRGISVNALVCDMTISGNVISDCSREALIYLNPGTTAYTISVSGNTLTGTSSVNGIQAVSKGVVSISKNTIKSCYYAVRITGAVKATVGTNYCSGNVID